MEKLKMKIIHFLDTVERTTNLSQVKTTIFQYASEEIDNVINCVSDEEEEEEESDEDCGSDCISVTSIITEEEEREPPKKKRVYKKKEPGENPPKKQRYRKWDPFNPILENNGQQCVGGGPRKCYHCKGYHNSLDAHLKKIWKSADKRAKEKGISFTLQLEQVHDLYKKQQGLCAISGVLMTFATPPMKGDNRTYKLYRRHNISLDQIVPSAGYDLINVQLVTVDVNRAKNFMLDNGFIEMCENVVDYQRRLRAIRVSEKNF